MRIILSIISLVLFSSCQYNDNPIVPGICISFDDRSIKDWYDIKDLLKEYDATATFFITQFDSLDETEIEMLKELQKDGHEIGFHGAKHVYAEYYIKENSYSSYLKYEIDEGLQSMRLAGFDCRSFAYPYGSKYWFTDYLLLKRFDIVRSVATFDKEENLKSIDDIYFRGGDTGVVSAIGIDGGSGVTSAMIDGAIKRAKRNGEVLMIYGHQPVWNNNPESYQFSTHLLSYFLEQSKQNGLKFYTFQELNKNVN